MSPDQQPALQELSQVSAFLWGSRSSRFYYRLLSCPHQNYQMKELGKGTNSEWPNHMVLSTRIFGVSGSKNKRLPSVKQLPRRHEPLNFKIYERKKRINKANLAKQISHVDLCLTGGNVPEIRGVPRSGLAESVSNNFLKAFFQKGKPKYERVRINEEIQERRKKQKQTIEVTDPAIVNFTSTLSRKPQVEMYEGASKVVVSYPRTAIDPSITLTRNIKSRNQSVYQSNRSEMITCINPEELSRNKPLLYLDPLELKQIKSESHIVMEYPSLQVVSGTYYRRVAQIASLTKIMTFYTVYQLSLDFKVDLSCEKVVIEDEVQDTTGTSAELVEGDEYTLQQLLYGLMLPSGNDAAIALAHWGGSLVSSNPEDQQKEFVNLMNKQAKKIKMLSSSFANPHGLPNHKNVSNPFDLAILIAACLKIPFFRNVVASKKYTTWITHLGEPKEVYWENTNKLLRRNGFIGVKTGVTVTAGPCLATCYQAHNDKIYIVVLLRASKLSRRFKETRLILGWTLKRLDAQSFGIEAKQILKHNAIEDSDNSEDEQQFTYEKMDAREIKKRNKILANEL